MRSIVYWAGIEYKYNIVEDVCGGFVYAFVRATDDKEAMSKIIDELKEQLIVFIDEAQQRVGILMKVLSER